MVQGFFFLKIMAANDSEYLASQPQSSALVFRGLGAEPTNKHCAPGFTSALLAAIIPKFVLCMPNQ